jgi:DNA polymerase-4
MCPQAIFVDGHPDRYRDYSLKVRKVLNSFTPVVEMASIDVAYLDLTGTGRLHGPPLSAARSLHDAVRRDTGLNCSIGIAAARMVAKVASDQAKPNGMLWVIPGQEAAFLAPLDVRKIPGVGKVTEKQLGLIGIRKVGDLAALDEQFLAERFGRWGLALAGKARGLDAGGWFDEEIGAGGPAKSISHEHTFNEDTADSKLLEATCTASKAPKCAWPPARTPAAKSASASARRATKSASSSATTVLGSTCSASASARDPPGCWPKAPRRPTPNWHR